MYSSCYINLLLRKLLSIGSLLSCVKTCTYLCRCGKVDDRLHLNSIPAAEQHQVVACLVKIYVLTWWNLNGYKLAVWVCFVLRIKVINRNAVNSIYQEYITYTHQDLLGLCLRWTGMDRHFHLCPSLGMPVYLSPSMFFLCFVHTAV